MLFWGHFSLGYTSNFKRVRKICLRYRRFRYGEFHHNLIGCGDGRDFNSGAAWVGSNLANCQTKAKALAFPLLKLREHRLVFWALPLYANSKGP